ncbi:AraC family transcriptional regulator [Opitutaceae bacterium TAV5]|nr:AraC family transcriptional regulator [Opitutaceae bacterium TAV5]
MEEKVKRNFVIFASMPARPVVTRKNRRPCILVALAWYSPAIHLGIARYAREAGWILDPSMTHGGFTMDDWRGDGAITLLPWNEKGCDHVRTSTRPIVNIGDVEIAGVPVVRYDDTLIGQMAADHFLERGFRNTAFFKHGDAPLISRRYDAFRLRIEENRGRTWLIEYNNQGGHRQGENARINWLKRQLASLPKPLAVFSAGDESACEILHACLDMNISVPDQIIVLGVDDDKLRCEFAPVPLSSVDINLEMGGYRAAALLDMMLQGKPVPPEVLLIPPVGITTRLSTDILAVKHPHVASALLHIWQHYTEQINAKTVASTVPLSYPTLHHAFIKHVGRTIADEITFKRMEKARFLLVNTGLRTRDIAEQCGFPNDDRLGRVFRRKLGMTPNDYRKRNQKSGL